MGLRARAHAVDEFRSPRPEELEDWHIPGEPAAGESPLNQSIDHVGEHASEESEGNLYFFCENLSDLVLDVDLGAPKK